MTLLATADRSKSAGSTAAPACPVLLLSPQTYSAHGGVQTYVRRIAEILSEYCGERGSSLSCVSYLDDRAQPDMHQRPVHYAAFYGSAGRKTRFASQAFRSALQRRRGIAVVSHIGQVGVAWSLWKAGLVRAYALVLHGIEAWRRSSGLDAIGARAANRIIATTAFTADEFRKHNGIPQDRLTIIPLALPIRTLPDPAPLRERDGVLRVLTVTRLSTANRYKGVDTLLDAISVVRAGGVDTRLTVVGSGDDLPRLTAMSSRLGLDGAVQFTGSVSDRQLHEYFQTCDVFALPSGAEGFGLVFLEAMGYGKPCIGGNHGGTPEVISDGLDGLLVPNGDVPALAAALNRFHDRPDLIADMGALGYRKIRDRYQFSNMRAAWFDMLDALVKV